MTASSSATESTTQPDIGRVAATIGDPTRIRMLLLLMEGRSLTAKELEELHSYANAGGM